MTRTHFRTATLALALAAMAGTASAQTVITTERPAVLAPPAVVTSPPAVVTTRPLDLTPAQRTTIYRTIVPRTGNRKPIVHEKIVRESVGRAPAVATERVVRPAPAVQYVVGDRVPAEVELAPIPQTVVTEVPAVSSYRYMVVNGRLLLVDPVTSTVVAEIQD